MLVVPEGSREEREDSPMRCLLQAVPRDPGSLGPLLPLRSVEVGCTRSPSNSEASSNRSHHNDTAVCQGGESHLWTGETQRGSMSPTQTKPGVNSGEASTVHFGEVLVCFNAPIRRWALSLAGALRTSEQGQGANQSHCVRVVCPLIWFRVLFAHPAPRRKPPSTLLMVAKHGPWKRWKERVPCSYLKEGAGR